MAGWHFLKHLTCTFGARSTTLSRRPLMRSSLLPFLFKHHHRVSYHCPSHNIPTKFKIHTAATASSTPYLSVLIHCPKHNADALGEALLCFGASSVSMDQNDVCQTIDEICITSIYPEDEDINMSISHAFDSIGFKEKPIYEIKAIEEEDWIKRSQESFQPVEVTKGLWVVPEWSTPPDVQATNIFLNPGHAFGTGEHASTKLCLLHLHGCITGGEYILDYGTGSGILAIAALKFGAAFAVGIDVDAHAIASAYQNAALNNIEPDKMQLRLIASENTLSSESDQTSGVVEGENTRDIQTFTDKDKYDVVIANILLNPLLDNADQIISCAKPGAVIGLSGILTEQVHRIIERYSPFLERIEVSKMDDWACVSGRKTRNLDAC
ncbi:ribosomal protein L11 methyltransferase [Trifolium repens]|nr:ribosomal protein L11 methyltransferase [Trifolium repens]